MTLSMINKQNLTADKQFTESLEKFKLLFPVAAASVGDDLKSYVRID